MAHAFGQWLRAAREARRYSTRELGKQAGFSSGYVSKLENATRPPDRDVVRAMASALGRSQAEAMLAAGYVDEHPEEMVETREFDHLIRRVDSRRRQEVMNAIRSVVELASHAEV